MNELELGLEIKGQRLVRLLEQKKTVKSFLYTTGNGKYIEKYSKYMDKKIREEVENITDILEEM